MQNLAVNMSVTSIDAKDGTSPVKTAHDPFRDERKGIVREVGNQAIWSLSSCKPGMVYELQVLCVSYRLKSSFSRPGMTNQKHNFVCVERLRGTISSI